MTVLFLLLYGTGLHFIGVEINSNANFQSGHGQTFNDPMMNAQKEVGRNMILLLGIYFSSSIVSLLAVFSSVGSVSSEIENGMLHAILAKPIRRRDVILGKYVGYALMLACYSTLLFTAVLALNHFMMGTPISGAVTALGLFILQPLIILAVSLAGSTMLSTLANGITVFMLYTIGVIGGMVEQVGALVHVSELKYTGIVSSLIIPIDSIYRMMVSNIVKESSNPIISMMYGPFGTVSQPSTAMIVYAFIYLSTFLFIAIRYFTRRDIG